jgi:hypothetical protein
MTDIRKARAALQKRLVEGSGTASPEQRRASFERAPMGEPLDALITKIADHAHRVTDDDIEAARAAGHSEDQIFELAVCAAVGHSMRQYDCAMNALDAALKEG